MPGSGGINLPESHGFSVSFSVSSGGSNLPEVRMSNDDFDSFLSSDLLELAGEFPCRSKDEDRPAVVGSSKRGGLTLCCIPFQKGVSLSTYEEFNTGFFETGAGKWDSYSLSKIGCDEDGVIPSCSRASKKVLSGTGAGEVASRVVEMWIGLIRGIVSAANKDPTPSSGSSCMLVRRSTSSSPDLNEVAPATETTLREDGVASNADSDAVSPDRTENGDNTFPDVAVGFVRLFPEFRTMFVAVKNAPKWSDGYSHIVLQRTKRNSGVLVSSAIEEVRPAVSSSIGRMGVGLDLQ